MLCRVSRIYKQLGLPDFSAVNLQVIGSEQTYGPHANVGQVNTAYMSTFPKILNAQQFRVKRMANTIEGKCIYVYQLAINVFGLLLKTIY